MMLNFSFMMKSTGWSSREISCLERHTDMRMPTIMLTTMFQFSCPKCTAMPFFGPRRRCCRRLRWELTADGEYDLACDKVALFLELLGGSLSTKVLCIPGRWMLAFSRPGRTSSLQSGTAKSRLQKESIVRASCFGLGVGATIASPPRTPLCSSHHLNTLSNSSWTSSRLGGLVCVSGFFEPDASASASRLDKGVHQCSSESSFDESSRTGARPKLASRRTGCVERPLLPAAV
mmetsp:Transcript_57485/g.160029  ORF Transcript_57485/g.160029 Transcript_57485/m.160029 type:complete len:233 (-) Transcript_57485:775-1473(-)